MTLAQLFEQEEQKGIEKGMEKGMEKGIEQIAIEMLKEGVDFAFISKITKLSIESNYSG